MENTPSPSTSAKNELISNIKEWIRLDTEISKKNAELKICKNAKTTLTKTLQKLCSRGHRPYKNCDRANTELIKTVVSH